jgi:hypothetical protein
LGNSITREKPKMKPTESGSTPGADPRNEQLFVALIKQADALEVSVRRAERKLKDSATFRADLALALVVIGLLFALALAVSPHLDLTSAPVPPIVSYVSSFAVLVFVYMAYAAFGNAVATHELKRALHNAWEDGGSAHNHALSTLEIARKEDVGAEARARIESALIEAEQADSRLRKLETQTREDIDNLARAQSGQRSSMLAAIIGGLVGATAGISIAPTAATIAVGGPVGAAIGVALAVLVWRGPSHWRVERASDRAQEALSLYQKELNRPSEDAPRDLRENLWERYDRVISSYAAVAEAAVSGAAAALDQNSASRRPGETMDLAQARSA